MFDALAGRVLDALVLVSGPALSTPGLDLGARVECAVRAAFEVLSAYPSLLRQLAAVPGTRFHGRLMNARQRAIAAARLLLELHRDEIVVDDRELSARILVDVAEGILFNVASCDDADRVAREAGRLGALYCTGRATRSRRARARQRV